MQKRAETEKKLGGPGSRLEADECWRHKKVREAEKVEMHSVLPHPRAPTHVTAGRMTGCLPPTPFSES